MRACVRKRARSLARVYVCVCVCGEGGGGGEGGGESMYQSGARESAYMRMLSNMHPGTCGELQTWWITNTYLW